MSDYAQAFPSAPILHHDGSIDRCAEYGLTKRELYAAMAMQGMSTHYRRQDTGDYANGMHPNAIAQDAVAVADALIAALAEPPHD